MDLRGEDARTSSIAKLVMRFSFSARIKRALVCGARKPTTVSRGSAWRRCRHGRLHGEEEVAVREDGVLAVGEVNLVQGVRETGGGACMRSIRTGRLADEGGSPLRHDDAVCLARSSFEQRRS